MTSHGPLAGLRIVEFAGIGPAPFAAMLLADLGADIVRIARPGSRFEGGESFDIRGRSTVELDLKDPAAIESCLDLCSRADGVIEGFRPGVLERLGLGPDILLDRNPKIVIGRITGFGQEGPYAQMAGHDLNYIAVTGTLFAIGGEDKPVPPLNLIGDYAGGSMFLVTGMLAALLHARETGDGQVIDAAMCDGASYLATLYHAFRHFGRWTDRRATNILDGGAPFYDTYRCADGNFVSIAPIEPQFFALLIDKLGLDPSWKERQYDEGGWPALRQEMTTAFAAAPREHWNRLFGGSDACYAPVLDFGEATTDPHAAARQAFGEADGFAQPAVAPRFSRTPAAMPTDRPSGPVPVGEILAAWAV